LAIASPAPAQDPLAFLGDAALGLVVAEHLLRLDPGATVGTLTPRRAALVAGDEGARPPRSSRSSAGW
jgi:dsRNA-specific ribonuclease